MEIIRLNFNKDKDFHTMLSDSENLYNLERYVFPVISHNEGWGTKDLDWKTFIQDPQKYQNEIDVTTWDNVHIGLIDGQPSALFGYFENDVTNVEVQMNKAINLMRLDNSNKLLDKFE